MNPSPNGPSGWRTGHWLAALAAVLLLTLAPWVWLQTLQPRTQSHLMVGLVGLQALVFLSGLGWLLWQWRRQALQCQGLQAVSHELTVARDEAEAANHHKSAFLARLAHEMRPPLRNVLGRLDRLDETRLSGSQRDHVASTRDSVHHLLSVLDDMLDVSTMESDRQCLSPEPARLRSLLKAVEDRVRARAPDNDLAQPAGTPTVRSDGAGDPPRRLRMLVAEDHPINLKYMTILLDQMGHPAVFCENGSEALRLLARQPFDVVLLDYHMPVLDGLATTSAIRALDGPNRDIKVVLVTADVATETRRKAQEVGVDAFATKPLQAQDLQAALQRCGLLDNLSTRVHDAGPDVESVAPPTQDGEGAAASLIDRDAYTEVVSMMPPDTLADMLGTLFESPEGSVHVLVASLATGDAGQIAHDAHKLKGSAMLMGFRALVRTAAQVERLAAEDNAALRRELGHQLLADAARTRQALPGFSPELPA